MVSGSVFFFCLVLWKTHIGNCGLIAELDCNAKLGRNIIADDPNEMRSIGFIFCDILKRRGCTVVNAIEKCKGCITRSRMKAGTKEESVLDYVFVNALVTPFINNMEIDESKEKSLTRYAKSKAIPSDLHVLTCRFNIPVKKKITPRKEVYRLRNPAELLVFREATTNTKKFTKCFMGDDDVKAQGRKWMKLLDNTIRTTFTKIRIRSNYNNKDDIFKKMQERKLAMKNLHNAQTVTEKHELEDKIKGQDRTSVCIQCKKTSFS